MFWFVADIVVDVVVGVVGVVDAVCWADMEGGGCVGTEY
jgi:hypothetical protein